MRLANETMRTFDPIVLATGYTPGLERIVDGFDAKPTRGTVPIALATNRRFRDSTS